MPGLTPQDPGVVGAVEMDQVVIAVEMVARHGEAVEQPRDLCHIGMIGGRIDVGNPVAQLEHGIDALFVGETHEIRRQRQGGIAALGLCRRAVMDIGDDGEAEGHDLSLRSGMTGDGIAPPRPGRRDRRVRTRSR